MKEQITYKEHLVGVKGKWIIKARFILYPGATEPRAELFLDADPNIQDDTGFTAQEWVKIYDIFNDWRRRNFLEEYDR